MLTKREGERGRERERERERDKERRRERERERRESMLSVQFDDDDVLLHPDVLYSTMFQKHQSVRLFSSSAQAGYHLFS